MNKEFHTSFVMFQYTYILRSLPVLVPFLHTTVTGSVYTIVAIAIERAASFFPSINKVIVREICILYIVHCIYDICQ